MFTSRKKSSKKSRNNTSLTYVNTSSRITRQLFPRRIISWLTTTFGGYIPAGTTVNGNFSVNATSVYEPFNSVADNINTSGKFTSSSTFTILANPVGYGEAVQIYDFYRVHKARITVTLTPNSNGDVAMLTVFPSPLGVTGTNMLQSTQQPYSKWKLVNPGAPNSANTISATHKSWDILGLTRSQFTNLQATGVGSAPVAGQSWFFNVEYQFNDSVNNSNAVYIIVTVEQYVEFSQPLYLST